MQLRLNEVFELPLEARVWRSNRGLSELRAVLAILSLMTMLFSVALQGARADDMDSTYVLHRNDQLNITVMGHDDYAKTVTILSDGTFAYPILGNVPAAGKTVEQLTTYMQHGLSKELNDPLITISLGTYFEPQLNIVGSVNKAGSEDYIPDWRVLDAIAAAGGLTVSPEAVNISILRPGAGLVKVDSVRLMSGGDDADNVLVHPGDTILVEQKDADELAVQISGEVKNPGSFSVPANGESALEALNDAGGAAPDGALQSVKLRHDGQTTSIDLSGSTESLDSSTLPVVMPGDQMVVPVNPNHIIIMGAVGQSQEYYIPEGKTLTLTDAIARAGGIVGGGDIKKILVERQVDGKPVSYSIDLGKVFRGGDQSQNIILQPGDVVYVPTRGQPTNNGAYLFALPGLLNFLK